MTLKECYAAANGSRRVVIHGIVYSRITRAGYYFNENGTFREFAEAMEAKTGTLVTARPQDIILETDYKEQ